MLEQLEIKILDKLKELNIFTLIYVQKGFFIFLVTFNKQVHSKHFIIVSSQLLLFVMGLKLFLLLSTCLLIIGCQNGLLDRTVVNNRNA